MANLSGDGESEWGWSASRFLSVTVAIEDSVFWDNLCLSEAFGFEGWERDNSAILSGGTVASEEVSG